jgi:hypothetical protein
VTSTDQAALAALPPVQEAGDEREPFERFIVRAGFTDWKRHGDGYLKPLVDRLWRAWPSRATQPRPVPGGVREADAWQWRACIGGQWGAWLNLDQPVGYFKGRNAFNLDNGTYELRPLYTIASLDVQEAGTPPGDSQHHSQGE